MPSKRNQHAQPTGWNFHGPLIRRIREARGHTLVDMSVAFEEYGYPLDATNLGHLERGERAISDIELHILADILEVTVADLMAEPTFVDKEDLINALKHVQRRYPKKNT